MQTPSAPLGPKGWIAPALAALCGVALLLALTASHGPGLDSDGAEYLAAAQSLLEGRGWIGVEGEPYVLWPPLQPLLLALPGGLGCAQGERAVALHALALAADALLAAAIVWRLTASRLTAAVASFAVVAIALPTATMAWSEPAFTALVLAALAALLRFGERRSRGSLAVLACCCALALAQRYVGVLLLGCVALALLVDRDGGKLGRRALRALAVSLAAALPVLAWALRNALIAPSAAANRGPASDSWSYDLRCALEQFVVLEPAPQALLTAGASALLVLGALALLRRGAARPELAIALLPFAFTAGLVVLRHWVQFDPLDARLLSPAHAVGALLGAVGAHELFGGRWRGLAALALGAWIAFALQRQFVVTRATLARAQSDGLGLYDNAAWRSSEALAALRAAPPAGAGFTNEPHALFLHAGLRARALPTRPSVYPRLYERWSAAPASERWILWFPFGGRAVLPQPEQHIELERSRAWADAELWRVR